MPSHADLPRLPSPQASARADVQLAALLYLLQTCAGARSDDGHRWMVARHLDLVAANADTPALLRSVCQRLAAQWRAEHGIAAPLPPPSWMH